MFAQKRRHSIHDIGHFVVEYFRGEELQSDGAVQVGVLGLVDDIHPALTQLLGDAVVRNGLADHVGPILPLWGLVLRATDVLSDQFFLARIVNR